MPANDAFFLYPLLHALRSPTVPVVAGVGDVPVAHDVPVPPPYPRHLRKALFKCRRIFFLITIS
jgi:hypothetical protein